MTLVSQACVCPSCARSQCTGHATLQLNAVCDTLSKFIDHRNKIYDVIDSAQVGTTKICYDERLAFAECCRDALNLVLTSLEVAADGWPGAKSGLAPALLHAVRSVMDRPILHLSMDNLNTRRRQREHEDVYCASQAKRHHR